MLCIVPVCKLLEDMSENGKGKGDSHSHNVSVRFMKVGHERLLAWTCTGVLQYW